MADIHEKARAKDEFGATAGQDLLTPSERKARGILRAIGDAEAAGRRCLEAAKAQTERAEAYAAQVAELRAQLEKLRAADG